MPITSTIIQLYTIIKLRYHEKSDNGSLQKQNFRNRQREVTLVSQITIFLNKH